MSPSSLLKNLGGLRDGLLVLVSLVYVLGFSVWSVVAWINNLGALPVLDAQYFTAGLPPFMAAVSVGALIHLSRRVLLEIWPRWLSSLSLKNQLLIHALLGGVALVILVALLGAEWLQTTPSDIGFAGGFLAVFFIGLLQQPIVLLTRWLDFLVDRGSLSQEAAKELRTHWGWKFIVRRPSLSNLYLLFAALGAAGIFYWTSVLYLKVPQEFGGAEPRCAQLDVVWSDLSPETRQNLPVASPSNEEQMVVGTKEVMIYFVGGESIMMRTREMGGASIELSRSAVKAFRWCS